MCTGTATVVITANTKDLLGLAILINNIQNNFDKEFKLDIFLCGASVYPELQNV